MLILSFPYFSFNRTQVIVMNTDNNKDETLKRFGPGNIEEPGSENAKPVKLDEVINRKEKEPGNIGTNPSNRKEPADDQAPPGEETIGIP